MNNNNTIFIEPRLPPILEVVDEWIGRKKKRTIKIINPHHFLGDLMAIDDDYLRTRLVRLVVVSINSLNDNNLQFSEEDIRHFGKDTSFTDDDLIRYGYNYNYRILKYYYNYMYLIHYINKGININDTENINKLIEILKNLYKLIYYNYSDIMPDFKAKITDRMKTVDTYTSIKGKSILHSINLFISSEIQKLLPGINELFEGISNILRQGENNNRKNTSTSNNRQNTINIGSKSSVLRKKENRRTEPINKNLLPNPILIRVPPDGDCGFHALSLFLRKDGDPDLTENEETNVDILRKILIQLYKQEEEDSQQELRNSSSLTEDMEIEIKDRIKRAANRISELRDVNVSRPEDKWSHDFDMMDVNVNRPEDKWLHDFDMILLAKKYGLCFSIYKPDFHEIMIWETITEDGILVNNNDYNQKCNNKKRIFLHNPNGDHYNLIVSLNEINDYTGLSFRDFEIKETRYNNDHFLNVYDFKPKKMNQVIENTIEVQKRMKSNKKIIDLVTSNQQSTNIKQRPTNKRKLNQVVNLNNSSQNEQQRNNNSIPPLNQSNRLTISLGNKRKRDHSKKTSIVRPLEYSRMSSRTTSSLNRPTNELRNPNTSSSRNTSSLNRPIIEDNPKISISDDDLLKAFQNPEQNKNNYILIINRYEKLCFKERKTEKKDSYNCCDYYLKENYLYEFDYRNDTLTRIERLNICTLSQNDSRFKRIIRCLKEKYPNKKTQIKELEDNYKENKKFIDTVDSRRIQEIIKKMNLLFINITNLIDLEFIYKPKTSITKNNEGYDTFSQGQEDQTRKRELLFLNKVIKNNIEEVINLLPNVNINTKNIRGYTALMIACKKGYTDIVRELLTRNDIDVNLKNKYNNTALILACQNGYTEIVRLLLTKNDIDVNLKNKNNDTALFLACYKGYTDIVRELLTRNDININEQISNGWTVLMFACNNGYTEIVRELLTRNDININEQNNIGWTALMIACKKRYIEIVRELLNRNDININEQNNIGRTALDIARSENDQYIITLLENYIRRTRQQQTRNNRP